MDKISKPHGEVLDFLKGSTTRVIIGEDEKNLVIEGSGVVGLEDTEENPDWAGLFNHVLKTARVATFLAERLKRSGVDVDPNSVLNSVLVSHSGRRQWEEAVNYPENVENAQEKKDKRDTLISVDLLQKSGISSDIIDNVGSHDILSKGNNLALVVDTWEKKLVNYADYRVSQAVISLKNRFEDLQRAVKDGRVSQEQLAQISKWANETEKEIFDKLDLLDPEDITDEYPKEAGWEKYLRRLYVQDAEKGIFEKLDEFEKRILEAKTDDKVDEIAEEIARDFPENTWWGKYIRDLHEEQNGKPDLETDEKGKSGIDRAVVFFKHIDSLGKIYQNEK